MTSERDAGCGGRWERFEHESDVGVRGIGASRDEAFEQAALALTSVVTDPATVRARDPVELSCDAPDPELLLVDWLNALVYEMATRSMVFGRFEVRSDGTGLRATAWGEPVQVERHRPAVEVKAATYYGVHVGRREDGAWVAECVLDV
jgi:SHS2 domain-containing protein